MKHYSHSSKHKQMNRAVNTIVFILFIILSFLIVRNASEKAVRNRDVLSINFNLSGPGKQFVIENADLPYFPDYKKEVLSQKIDFRINQKTNTVIVQVKDSAWQKGYMLTDSAILPPLDPNNPITHLFMTIGYDSITNIQSNIRREPGGLVEGRKSLFNNIWFISLLAAICLAAFLFKIYYHLKKFRNKRTSEATTDPVTIENVKQADQDSSYLEKEHNRLFQQIFEVLEGILDQKRTKESQIEEISDKHLKKILLKTDKELSEKNKIEAELDSLVKSVKAIHKSKQIVFASSLFEELNEIQAYYENGKGLYETCKKLGLGSASAKSIEMYINDQLQALQQQADISAKQYKYITQEKAMADREIANLKEQLNEYGKKQNALLKKNETRDQLAQHLLDIMSKFENDILGSNSNIMTELEYRQFILPKLLEITFYSIDFIKWYNDKQNFSDENIKILEKAEHGNIVMPVVDDEKIIREINTRKNEAIFNKLIPILKGEDLATGNIKKADNPKVFIKGRKLDIE